MLICYQVDYYLKCVNGGKEESRHPQKPEVAYILQSEGLSKLHDSKKVEAKYAPPDKIIEVLIRHCFLPQNFYCLSSEVSLLSICEAVLQNIVYFGQHIS